MSSPTFTSDWFSDKTKAWIEHVVPRIRHSPGARWLEVGTYEGRSTLWTLDHVLPPDGTITCVDDFDSSPTKLQGWGIPGYELRFAENVKDRNNVIVACGKSADVLPALRGQTFHGCYLDGNHSPDVIKHDLELIWNLLLQGAVLVCDDYNWPPHPETHEAIDQFLAAKSHRVLFIDFQIIVLKTE
jgi:predicted O-methyltransferase YrrM